MWERLISFQLSGLCAVGTQKWWERFLFFLMPSSVWGLRSLIMQNCYKLCLPWMQQVTWILICMHICFAEVNLEMLILHHLVMKYQFARVLYIKKWLHYSLLAVSLQHSSMFPASTPSGLSDDPQSVSPSPSYMWSSNAPPRYSPPYFPPFEKPPPYTP